MIKYKQLYPRYIADIHDLKSNHPKTLKELEEGNLSVTKNDIPFVSIGADHAYEHIMKQAKVHSGLVEISINTNVNENEKCKCKFSRKPMFPFALIPIRPPSCDFQKWRPSMQF